MDPSLPVPAAAPLSATNTTTAMTNQGYPESVDSSPRSRNTESWDEPLPPVPGAKLRLMCSYGGHIVPRPHDKSLCYIGGDTRIIVVDRNSSLSSLSLRLSRSLLNGRSFTLKYQLPNEDLDSLISVTTDEDLENMVEEYDRTSSGSLKPSRLRLFLFLSKPETASSMGSLLDDSKSKSWFIDALNGSGNLPRGLSADSASVNCLLGLDDVVQFNRDVETQNDSMGNINKQMKNTQDVQSIPNSPVMETNSSFGSTSSSPSMSNLPPIRVHVEDQKVGLEDHFTQMNVAVHNQDEGFALLSSPPPRPTTITVSAGVQSGTMNSSGVVTENQNRVLSDDERSEYGNRKTPQPPQPQLLQKTSGGVDLPSPDGTGRDNNIPNVTARTKPVYHQEQIVQQVQPRDNRIPANPIDPNRDVSDPNYRIQIQQQQIQESGYPLSSQQFDQQQQQFIAANGAHYIHHQGTGQVPISPSYYHPMYMQQQHHHQIDQQIPMYYVPVHQTQPYNMSMQSNMNETSQTLPNRPPTPTMISTSGAYKEPANPGYPPRSPPPPKQPELASTVYRTTATGPPQIIHTATDQHQQQQHFVSYHPMHHPSQSIQAVNTAGYAYEYSDPAHAQIYYTQPLTSHYQTMNGAAAVAAVSEATDHNTNKQ